MPFTRACRDSALECGFALDCEAMALHLEEISPPSRPTRMRSFFSIRRDGMFSKKLPIPGAPDLFPSRP